MSVNTIDHRQNGTTLADRYLSPNIWADCPIDTLLSNPTKGIFYFDDFRDLPLNPTLTTQIAYGKYKAFADSGSLISKLSLVNSAEVLGGALTLALDTDNDGVSLAQAWPSFRLSGVEGTDGKLWFECSYAQNSIATNMASVIIGLAEVELWTLSSTVPLNDADTLDASASFIGFSHLEDAVGKVDSGYADRATSITRIGTTIKTLAANTFTKFGFKYDPSRSEDCIRFYVDNVLNGSVISRTTLTGMTNLDANALGLIVAATADSAGTSFAGYLKWWACAQLQPDTI